ncbi:MAG: DNA polymerase III subunit alpha [Coprobacillus sp.]|nr:DNA polymerase III subunit alpha [Coprobacillus sp.]
MFTPLRIITGYTFLSSGLSVDKTVGYLKKTNYLGAGICDRGVLYGLAEFYHLMKGIDKKPIVGIELVIDSLVCAIYIISEESYRDMCQLSALLDEYEVSLKDIERFTKNSLVVIDTSTDSFQALFENDLEMRKKLLSFSKAFKECYLGIEVISKEDKLKADRVRKFARQYPYPLVAFPKIRYKKEEDAISIKIAEAIRDSANLEEKSATGEECFHDESYYQQRYTKEEIDNTEKILSSSTFDYFMKRGKMIHYSDESDKNLLKERAFKGLESKNLANQEYVERLNYELEVIEEMGYNDYFLVVADYVRYARENHILTGPGRGSAGGSLVAYALGITTIDPIKHSLRFERFLNKSRKSMPDIDVDFADNRRDEVVEYVREKYGKNRVANIVTFQTIGAKQALRDIGRVYQYKNSHIDRLCKMLGKSDVSLRESYLTNKIFKEEVDRDKYVLEIVTLASKIEGLPRQSGQHAAGIVLNDEPLENAIPITKDFDGNYIVQYEMTYLEEDGFLKMDFLGLKNLTIIDNCVALINRTEHLHLDPFNLDWDKKEAYEVISRGETMGLFQIESEGMLKSIREIQPTCFDDIVALLALFRPGPMSSIPMYAKRKKGLEKVTYLSKDMERILAPTYGIIVYQEQINEIATTMAALSPDEADNFRRAVSKKDATKMVGLEREFIEGAKKNGYSEKDSKETFKLIEKFAEYGFNKSHAVGYAVVTVEMAYLKALYPLQFYACILDSTSGSDPKFNQYLVEMRKNNYNVALPSINYSTARFEIKDNTLLYPLTGIKGLNVPNAYDILREREINGKFEDFYSFVTRMFPYHFTENMVTKLIDAGAFDEMNPSRASLRASILYAFQLAKLSVGENGQLTLGLSLPKPKIIVDKDDLKDNLEREKECLGTNLSKSPLSYRQDLLAANEVTPLEKVTAYNKTYNVAGMVLSVKKITTKNKQNMAYIKIFDDVTELEVTVFPSLYEKVFDLLTNYNCLLIRGKKDQQSFIAEDIKLLEESI